jgi:hypothetical protein
MMATYTPGLYSVEIVGQGFEESAKRNPCLALQFRVLNRVGPGGTLEPCPNDERTYRQYFGNDVGASILRDDLLALGVQVERLSQLHPADHNHVSLVGCVVDLACKLEAYNGREVERWTVPRRASVGLALDKVRELDDKYGSLFARGPGQPATPRPPVSRNDSDTPF